MRIYSKIDGDCQGSIGATGRVYEQGGLPCPLFLRHSETASTPLGYTPSMTLRRSSIPDCTVDGPYDFPGYLGRSPKQTE